MTPAITEYATREALMQATAERITRALGGAIAQRGAACAALSGGATPVPAYRLHAGAKLDWPKVTFALVDERFVPPDDAASNEGLVRRELKPAFDGGARFIPMYAPHTLGEAGDAANALYAPLTFDIVLMGMGVDGHTASWFPGAAKLGEALDMDNPRSVLSLTAPQAEGSPERLTLTRAALTRASRLILLIAGEEKRARLEAALAGDWAPAAALFAPALPEPEILWAP